MKNGANRTRTSASSLSFSGGTGRSSNGEENYERGSSGKPTRSKESTPSSNQANRRLTVQHPFWGDVSL